MNIFDINTQPDSSHGAVGWLMEFNDVKGDLSIRNINNILSLEDAKNANLVSKHNLETLSLDWGYASNSVSKLSTEYSEEKGILDISICDPEIHNSHDVQDFEVLEILQPQCNLRHLYISSYRGSEFPRWMADPLLCSSHVKLCIDGCSRVRFLPLGNVHSLKQLHIKYCERLLHLKRESLPSQLEHLTIANCVSLIEVSLSQSLTKLFIIYCKGLRFLSMADQNISGLKNFPSLEKVSIWSSPFIEANQLLIPENCHINFVGTPHCLLHNFKYDGSVYLLVGLGVNDVDDEDEDVDDEVDDDDEKQLGKIDRADKI